MFKEASVVFSVQGLDFASTLYAIVHHIGMHGNKNGSDMRDIAV